MEIEKNDIMLLIKVCQGLGFTLYLAAGMLANDTRKDIFRTGRQICGQSCCCGNSRELCVALLLLKERLTLTFERQNRKVAR